MRGTTEYTEYTEKGGGKGSGRKDEKDGKGRGSATEGRGQNSEERRMVG